MPFISIITYSLLIFIKTDFNLKITRGTTTRGTRALYVALHLRGIALALRNNVIYKRHHSLKQISIRRREREREGERKGRRYVSRCARLRPRGRRHRRALTTVFRSAARREPPIVIKLELRRGPGEREEREEGDECGNDN